MAIQQKTSGFRSIRHRIVVFSILVTLVPSFGMGWYFYAMLYRTTTEKTEQRLMDAAGALEREINLWLKERDRELHVFSNSQVITENLKGDNRASANLRKIINYLTIIKDQFHDYRKLLVFDGQGQTLAVSDLSVEGHPLALPADWKDRIETSKFFIGEVYSKEDEISPLMLIGIPLLSEKQGDPLGIFAAEIRLAGLLPFLKNALSNGQAKSGKILLIEKNGRRILATSGPGEQKGLAPPAPEEIRLLNTPGHLRKFINNQGKQMVGMGLSFKDVPWDLVIVQSFDEIFAEVIQSGDRIILMAVLFSLIIGLCASILARQILVPLIALTQGVLRVANGELDISLNIRRNDEFGIVTGMFNTMVKQLKQSYQELEQLATTDTLTKLANRKQIMTSLNGHVEYYRRYSTEFSILMIDIDYFKNINDTHGHLAGDAVLFQMAQIFTKELRSMDIAGRYGGEEFLIILGQTDLQQATLTAERIRQAVELHPFTFGDIALHITISIGVTGIIQKDDTDTSMISRADKALYEAKAKGRNQVILRAELTPAKPLTSRHDAEQLSSPSIASK